MINKGMKSDNISLFMPFKFMYKKFLAKVGGDFFQLSINHFTLSGYSKSCNILKQCL